MSNVQRIEPGFFIDSVSKFEDYRDNRWTWFRGHRSNPVFSVLTTNPHEHGWTGNVVFYRRDHSYKRQQQGTAA